MSITPSLYAKARAETAKLLGYGDDIDGLTAEQSTRLDIACALRIALDDQAAKLLRGESADVSKLLSASEALGRLLPPAVLAAPPSVQREDPREVMFKIYMEMRERGEVPPEGHFQHRINELEAEVAALKAGSAPALPDVATLVERMPAPAGNVVPLPKPPSAPVSARAAADPPQYDYNREQGLIDTIEHEGYLWLGQRG
jgi:hypothetical protein